MYLAHISLAEVMKFADGRVKVVFLGGRQQAVGVFAEVLSSFLAKADLGRNRGVEQCRRVCTLGRKAWKVSL